jgi:hypothetical protein
VQGAISRLARSTHQDAEDHRNGFLSVFKKISKEKDPGLSDTLDAVRQMDDDIKEQKDYTYHVRALYGALSAYRWCDDETPSSKSLSIKLRLNTYEENDESLTFSMLFLPHPHLDHLCNPIQWQDTQVCVSMAKPSKKRYIQALIIKLAD